MKRDPRIPRWRYLSRHRTWLCGDPSGVPFATVAEQLDGLWRARAWFVRGFEATIAIDDVADPLECRRELVQRMVAYLEAGGQVGDPMLEQVAGTLAGAAISAAGMLSLFDPEVP